MAKLLYYSSLCLLLFTSSFVSSSVLDISSIKLKPLLIPPSLKAAHDDTIIPVNRDSIYYLNEALLFTFKIPPPAYNESLHISIANLTSITVHNDSINIYSHLSMKTLDIITPDLVLFNLAVDYRPQFNNKNVIRYYANDDILLAEEEFLYNQALQRTVVNTTAAVVTTVSKIQNSISSSLYSFSPVKNHTDFLLFQNNDIPPTLPNRGNNAGSFSYNEMTFFMKEVARFLGPSVASLNSIGNTTAGDPIFVLAVGTNNDKDMTPAVLYTGLHHGREPMSAHVVLKTLEYLVHHRLELEILLATRTLYFLPIVNPTGYKMNEDAQVWKHAAYQDGVRKNGNEKGSCKKMESGVDLNRNYDICFTQDNVGSSNNKCQEDYRGPTAFSEPETLAIKAFLQNKARHIKIALNYHSYGKYINIPNACMAMGVTKDDVAFREIASTMTLYNHYEYGQSWSNQSNLYSVNGEASDYMYNTFGIFAMSPETGPEFHVRNGFWPFSNTVIRRIEEESLYPNLYAAAIAGSLYFISSSNSDNTFSLWNHGIGGGNIEAVAASRWFNGSDHHAFSIELLNSTVESSPHIERKVFDFRITRNDVKNFYIAVQDTGSTNSCFIQRVYNMTTLSEPYWGSECSSACIGFFGESSTCVSSVLTTSVVDDTNAQWKYRNGIAREDEVYNRTINSTEIGSNTSTTDFIVHNDTSLGNIAVNDSIVHHDIIVNDTIASLNIKIETSSSSDSIVNGSVNSNIASFGNSISFSNDSTKVLIVPSINESVTEVGNISSKIESSATSDSIVHSVNDNSSSSSTIIKASTRDSQIVNDSSSEALKDVNGNMSLVLPSSSSSSTSVLQPLIKNSSSTAFRQPLSTAASDESTTKVPSTNFGANVFICIFGLVGIAHYYHRKRYWNNNNNNSASRQRRLLYVPGEQYEMLSSHEY